MSTNKKNNIKEKEILESSVVESKRNNKKSIYLILSFIGLFCAVVCFLVLSNNKKVKFKEDNKDNNTEYQFINFDNFEFRMKEDWKLINNKEIQNDKETMHISLSTLDVPFDLFVSEEYQKEYLETYQTENNVIINKSGKDVSEDKEYFYMDGFNDGYNYYVIVVGNDKKVILITSEFIDKVTYTNLKQDLIDFALSREMKG